MEWCVKFKDIDPDTGGISQETVIAICPTERDANWVKESLEKDWFSVDGSCDPNREFFVKPKELEYSEN